MFDIVSRGFDFTVTLENFFRVGSLTFVLGN